MSIDQMRNSVITVIMGVIILAIGLIVADIVVTQAETRGVDASIGSFSGVQSLNDLIPLLYYVALIVLGIGLIGIGGFTAARNV